MPKDEVIAGIYCMSFSGYNKSYIGSSINICNRGRQHLNDLKNGKHANNKLQNAFNKYGWESWNFDILEICDNPKNIRTVEQRYLDSLFLANSDDFYFRNNSLNLSKKATGGNIGDKLRGKNNKRHKKISVFNLEGQFIEEIDGVREAERKYKVSGIHKCCKGKIGRCGDFIFRYSDNLNVKYAKKTKRKKYTHKNVDKIYEYNLNGDFVREWRCIEEATKELEIFTGGISRVLSGKYSHVNNRIFRKEKSDKISSISVVRHSIVQLYDKDMNFIEEFDNFNKAATYLNSSRSSIAYRCKDGKLFKKQYYLKIKN